MERDGEKNIMFADVGAVALITLVVLVGLVWWVLSGPSAGVATPQALALLCQVDGRRSGAIERYRLY